MPETWGNPRIHSGALAYAESMSAESGVPEIAFAHSERSTLGIEWEVALVDRSSGELISVADQVLDALRSADGTPHPRITGELLLNTVELVSDVHHQVADAVADLRDQIQQVRAAAAVVDDRVELICAGSHPFSQWYNQPVTDKPRYHKLIERTRWWGRNMMIWGVHVHVGVESQEKIIPLLNGMLSYLPHLQALSASSPFWAGVETGYASNRALMFQQLPTAGLPYEINDWAEYEAFVWDLQRTGVIEEYTEVRSDIRPAPQWGTIEVRVCDGVSTPREIASLAALIQSLVEYLSRKLDRGEELTVLQPWYVRENKWRAARYGLAARIITDRDGSQREVARDILDLVGELMPIATELGCATELAAIPGTIRSGASYQRQLAVASGNGGNLSAVVSHLIAELKGADPRAVAAF